MTSYMRFTRVKRVEKIDRLKNSRNGNPRFKFVFEDGEINSDKAIVTNQLANNYLL